jgi:hypothetical protein
VPSSKTEQGIEYRSARLRQIKMKQFDLVYYGHFSWSDTIRMSSSELNWNHTRLLEVKNEEREAQEKAFNEAQSQREAASVQNKIKNQLNSHRSHSRRRR